MFQPELAEKYKNIDLTEWNQWFNKFILPVFKSAEREKYYETIKKMQAPFYPKYWIAEKFYEGIKNDRRFDDELKFFFSFLYSCGFFMDNIISFEEWISINNWEYPWIKNDISNLFDKTIIEILSYSYGDKYLKNKFRWFPFLSRSDGY